MARWVVYVTAMGFLGFGVAFYARPVELLAFVSIALEQGVSRTEIRAVYGGMNTGVALVLFWLALRGRFGEAAALSAVTLGAVVAGRFLGMSLDGSAVKETFQLVGLEGFGCVANALAWRAVRGARTPAFDRRAEGR